MSRIVLRIHLSVNFWVRSPIFTSNSPGSSDGFVVGADERQIFAAQFERQRAALTRLEIDLRETSQPLTWRRYRSDEIAHVDQHRFFAGATAGVCDRYTDRQLFVRGNRLFAESQIAVSERRVTQSFTKLRTAD